MAERTPLDHARTRVEELVRTAEAGTDTIVTRDGHDVAVVIGIERWRALLAGRRSVLDTLAGAPRLDEADEGLFDRDEDAERPTELP
jgi:prevent-host-death family protein